MKLLRLCLVVCTLFVASAAWGQNYVYTFYDGSNGTGNVLAVYTGPLITASLNGTNAGQAFVVDTTLDGFTSTALQNCAWASNINNVGCSSSTFYSFALVFNQYGPPMSLGTYNLGSPYTTIFSNFNIPGVARFNAASFTIALAVPNYSCTGFEAPFDVALSLKQKVQRAIPLMVQLFDASGNLITDTTIAGAAPVINVSYAAVNSAAVDDTSLLDAIGQASTGNVLKYNSTTQTWQFNLGTSAFTAPGTYTVSLRTGDSTSYTVSPTCIGTFVRQ